MRLLTVLLFTILLAGCASSAQRHADQVAYATRVCDETAIKAHLKDIFMKNCVAMELGQPYDPALTPTTQRTVFLQAPPSTDSYGPYGSQGPSWSQFKQRFNEERMMQPMPNTRFQPSLMGPYGAMGPRWNEFNAQFAPR